MRGQETQELFVARYDEPAPRRRHLSAGISAGGGRLVLLKLELDTTNTASKGGLTEIYFALDLTANVCALPLIGAAGGSGESGEALYEREDRGLVQGRAI